MLVNFRVKGHVEVLLGHEQRLYNERVWPSQCQNWQKKIRTSLQQRLE